MRPFTYARPATLAETVALLAVHGADARVLAGGTDLIIRLRDGTARPLVVVDVKRVAELAPSIGIVGDRLVISATSTMTDIETDPVVCQHFEALAEAASVVGSVQIRNRATVAGNLCNASPAADTAPSLLVYGAEVVAAGEGGTRRIPLDAFFVRSGVTTLLPGELVTAIEVPLPREPLGATHVRRTRRRGHDLASVTLACSVDRSGVTRLAYGSVGPRPVLTVDDSGTLADPLASVDAKGAILERMFAAASPSPRSMRASPDYRLAMLRVLGRRAVRTSLARLAAEA